jgi:hypothetical protein
MKTAIRVLIVLLLLFLMAAVLVAVSAAEETHLTLPGFVQSAGQLLGAQMQWTIRQAQILRAGGLPGATP